MSKPVNSINGYVSKDQAMLLALKGVGVCEIANQLRCDKAYISRLLKPYRDHINAYIAFSQHKDVALESKQFEILRQVNPSTIKNMAAAQAVTSVAILEDKIRLIRNQSTSNTQSISVVARVDDSLRDLGELRKQLEGALERKGETGADRGSVGRRKRV